MKKPRQAPQATLAPLKAELVRKGHKILPAQPVGSPKLPKVIPKHAK